ncbi:MAG: hypothetical protein V1908_02120 [Candidatus Peregrinibacteria bacterium]
MNKLTTPETAGAPEAGAVETEVLTALETQAETSGVESVSIAEIAEEARAPEAATVVQATTEALANAAQNQPTTDGKLEAMRGALENVVSHLETAADTRNNTTHALIRRWRRPSPVARMAQIAGLSMMALFAVEQHAAATQCEDDAVRVCARMHQRGQTKCLETQRAKLCKTVGKDTDKNEDTGKSDAEKKAEAEAKAKAKAEARAKAKAEAERNKEKKDEKGKDDKDKDDKAESETPSSSTPAPDGIPGWLWAALGALGIGQVVAGVYLRKQHSRIARLERTNRELGLDGDNPAEQMADMISAAAETAARTARRT